jgi:hypothetical protein
VEALAKAREALSTISTGYSLSECIDNLVDEAIAAIDKIGGQGYA